MDTAYTRKPLAPAEIKRQKINPPRPAYLCNETGMIVVDIAVDAQGKVVSAVIGKGTTNTASCLVDESIKAAKKTLFSPDPSKKLQHGKLVYRFSLE